MRFTPSKQADVHGLIVFCQSLINVPTQDGEKSISGWSSFAQDGGVHICGFIKENTLLILRTKQKCVENALGCKGMDKHY